MGPTHDTVTGRVRPAAIATANGATGRLRDGLDCLGARPLRARELPGHASTTMKRAESDDPVGKREDGGRTRHVVAIRIVRGGGRFLGGRRLAAIRQAPGASQGGPDQANPNHQCLGDFRVFPRHLRPGSHRSRQISSETLAEVARAVTFFVEDETGRVEVHPEGSEVDAKKVVDRFEPSASPGFTLGGTPVPFGEEARTLGYRYTESVLPIDAPVYVLGVVRDDGGIGAGSGQVDAPIEELPLMKGGELASNLPSSRDKERRFVISHRSEEALEQDLARTVFWMAVAAVGALAVGVIVAMAGFLLAIS